MMITQSSKTLENCFLETWKVWEISHFLLGPKNSIKFLCVNPVQMIDCNSCCLSLLVGVS